MSLKSFLSRFGKRDKEVEEYIQAERHIPLASLDIVDPLSCVAVEMLLPLSFSVGDVPIRMRATRLATGVDAFQAGADGPWFVWKADTPAGKVVGYWYLPGPTAGSKAAGQATDAAAWEKTAASIALAAAARLKALLASRPGTVPASFAAGPCAAPNLQGKSVFRFDFRYAARGAFREGCAYSSSSYPIQIAKAMGCAEPELADYPIEAVIAGSAAMTQGCMRAVWAPRAFKYAIAGGERTYIPLYELFNILPDADLRLVIQNDLAIKERGGALGALFMYRIAVKTDKGVIERIVPPHSFDHDRAYPMFPEAVLDEGRLDPGNAASSLDDFLRRNDAAYEDLFRAIAKDSLSLSETGSKLIREIYVAMIYARKRRSLDAFVKDGRPFDELAKLPERVARRAVDLSGAKALAAVTFGSPDALAFVSKWCSSRKREEIAEECKRIESALETGAADISAIITDRFAILNKAKDAAEADRVEREASRKRVDRRET